jgi:hypothetical protein
VTGTGDEAVRGKAVVVDLRLFLNRGTEITATKGGTRAVIDLGHRDCIAGLRYGIEGMRVGGKRELKIGPHLAYGDEGVSGLIPPNALIRAEVELIDVRDPEVRRPEDYPPGRHLYAFRPGESARNLPRWQFGLQEDGRGSVLITYPIPGMPWRRNPMSLREVTLDLETTKALFDEVLALPSAYPGDCIPHEALWADHTEKANAITRDEEMRIIDYVVVHELCHLRHHDHSKAFWKMLGLCLPDYPERKEWLRVNGGLLSLD